MWLLAALLFLFQDPIEEGRKALDANQFDRAVELFGQAVAKEPKDYAAHFHLALAYSLKNDDAHAIPEYQKTLELKPGLYQAELNLGISLLRANQPAEAIKPLEAAMAQKPAEAQPKAKLATAYVAISRTQPLEEAAASIKKATDLDPKYNDARLELAGRYEKEKQPDAAIAIYKDFPQNVGAQERLGELLIEAKHFDEAIPKLEQAVAQSPTSANRLALATAYRMNKQPDREAALLAQAVAADPSNYNLHMIYGRTLRDERKFRPAAQQFYAAAQKRPDAVEAWNEMAAASMLAEDYAPGLAALDKVKALGKETAGNQFLRAITLDRLKQLKPALESYEQFLASDGNKNPDQEFQARQRARIIKLELSKK